MSLRWDEDLIERAREAFSASRGRELTREETLALLEDYEQFLRELADALTLTEPAPMVSARVGGDAR